jgi:GNAT superfamily N-acetyltransferase
LLLGMDVEVDGTAVTMRAATALDADACGRVIHAAFGTVNTLHGFETRWPSAEFAAAFARDFLARRGIYGVVAERGGEVIGCNFLDERGEVRGVGPTAVLPAAQGVGAGRALMEHVLHRAAEARRVRLLQDAFNTASLSLYTSLGFAVREPIALISGRPTGSPPTSHEIRGARHEDREACNALCRSVHGFDRDSELSDAIDAGTALVAERGGKIAAYATGHGLRPPDRPASAYNLAHSVAQTDADARALILAASGPIEFLLPAKRADFFRWCLAQGLNVIKVMTLMSRGEYAEPEGWWCPSVLY